MSKFYENEKTIIAALILLGISEVEVEFDGSSDSGSISGVSIKKDGNYINESDVKVAVRVHVTGRTVFDTTLNKWVQEKPQYKEVDLIEALKDHVYEALADTGVDWYNNDGGFGSWIWTAADGIDFNVNQREVRHDLAYSSQRQVSKADAESDEQADVS